MQETFKLDQNGKFYAAVFEAEASSKVDWIGNFLYSTINTFGLDIDSWDEADRAFQNSIVEIQKRVEIYKVTLFSDFFGSEGARENLFHSNLSIVSSVDELTKKMAVVCPSVHKFDRTLYTESCQFYVSLVTVFMFLMILS